jgi:two-component system response regulator HydG
MDGITLLKRLKLYDPGVVVVIMTAYASTESAVQALKFGAFDYGSSQILVGSRGK